MGKRWKQVYYGAHGGLPLMPHAEERANQRGIRDEVIELLLHYGREIVRSGRTLVFVDQAIRRRISDELGDKVYARVANGLDSYAVLDGGRIVTVGHRQERLYRVKGRHRHGR